VTSVYESVFSEATLAAAHDEIASHVLERWLQCACTVSLSQMITEQLLANLHYISESRVQAVASLSGALIQADVERQLGFVEVVSDEARCENLICFLLGLLRPEELTKPLRFSS
jgi:hypothetical protein